MSDVSDARQGQAARDRAGTAGARGPVGILAGGGRLPLDVADAIIAGGRGVHLVAIRGEADPRIERFSHGWIHWGGIGAMLRAFRNARCREIVIAGAVRRPTISQFRPDLGCITALPVILPLFKGGDDTALTKVVRFFESHGFVVRGAHQFAPHLLADEGRLGSVGAGPDELAAIGKAAAFIKALGPFDVGQAVVADPRRIVAVEGARGTDAMLDALIVHAAGRTAPGAGGSRRGGVFVKLPKPGQELRVDMPAIGPETVDRVSRAGLSGIAVAAGATLMLARDDLAQRVEAAGLFLIGLDERTINADHPGQASATVRRPGGRRGLTALGRKSPSPAQWRDIELGQDLLRVLKLHESGNAAVIARQYVLAVQGCEPVTDMIAMAAKGRPWGRLMRGRKGVLMLGNAARGGHASSAARMAVPYEAMLNAAGKAGLAGLACLDLEDEAADLQGMVAAADAAGLFLAGPGRSK